MARSAQWPRTLWTASCRSHFASCALVQRWMGHATFGRPNGLTGAIMTIVEGNVWQVLRGAVQMSVLLPQRSCAPLCQAAKPASWPSLRDVSRPLLLSLCCGIINQHTFLHSMTVPHLEPLIRCTFPAFILSS
jgi:hypothetical protein